MKQFNTGNEDLNAWLSFYHNSNKSTTKYINLLKKIDKSFLTTAPPVDIEDEINDYLPENGLLELDFRLAAFNDQVVDPEIYNRIAIAVFYNVNLEKLQKKYGEEFKDILDKILVEGSYEIYDIEFSRIVTILFQKNLMTKSDLMAVSLLRGMAIGKRYEDKKAQNRLKKLIFKNKLKQAINI